MKTIRKLRHALFLFAPLALVSAALADTWVVDDDGGPGIDFTSVQAAVAAAHNGDVILVHPGAYSAFSVDKGLTIVGLAPGVNVSWASLANLSASRKVRLANMTLAGLHVLTNAGTVLAQDLEVGRVYVANCVDVRLMGLESHSAEIEDSHVEIVQSAIVGEPGMTCIGDFDCCGGDGDTAVKIVGTSEVHIAHCTLLGGDGGDCDYAGHQVGGNGGHGLDVGSQATAIVTGLASNLFQGGFRGFGGGGSSSDGYDGHGVRNIGILRVSGVTVQDLYNNGTLITPTPADASLSAEGLSSPGQMMHLTVHGPVGAGVFVLLGRTPRFVSTGGILTELMTAPLRTISLGEIGAAGSLDYDFVIPGNLPPGYLIIAQGLVVDSIGTSRTNSVTSIMR